MPPIYSYKCQECGELTDHYNTIDNRAMGPDCRCGSATKLSIQPTQLQPILGGGDFPGYQCPVTDTFVTSRKERKEIMKRHNLIEKGDGRSGKQASGL